MLEVLEGDDRGAIAGHPPAQSLGEPLDLAAPGPAKLVFGQQLAVVGDPRAHVAGVAAPERVGQGRERGERAGLVGVDRQPQDCRAARARAQLLDQPALAEAGGSDHGRDHRSAGLSSLGGGRERDQPAELVGPAAQRRGEQERPGAVGRELAEQAARRLGVDLGQDQRQRLDDLERALGPLAGVAREQLGDQVRERVGQLGSKLTQRGRVAVDPGDQALDRVALERQLAGEQLPHHAAERVQVRARVEWSALDLLGRHVVDGPDDLAGPGQLGHVGGLAQRDAEVRELDDWRIPALEQHVGRLDVAVDDPLAVDVVERRGDLDQRDDHRGRLGADQRAQVPGAQVLHRVEAVLTLDALVEHTDAVGVVEAGDRPELAAEPEHGLGVVDQLGPQQLDCQLVLGLAVDCPEHLARAATTEAIEDLIARQLGQGLAVGARRQPVARARDGVEGRRRTAGLRPQPIGQLLARDQGLGPADQALELLGQVGLVRAELLEPRGPLAGRSLGEVVVELEQPQTRLLLLGDPSIGARFRHPSA